MPILLNDAGNVVCFRSSLSAALSCVTRLLHSHSNILLLFRLLFNEPWRFWSRWQQGHQKLLSSITATWGTVKVKKKAVILNFKGTSCCAWVRLSLQRNRHLKFQSSFFHYLCLLMFLLKKFCIWSCFLWMSAGLYQDYMTDVIKSASRPNLRLITARICYVVKCSCVLLLSVSGFDVFPVLCW